MSRLSSSRDSRRRSAQPGDEPAIDLGTGFPTSSDSVLPAPTTFKEYKRKKQQNLSAPTFKIPSAGESGRRGFHPWHFVRIIFWSSNRASNICNLLWPVVPAALAVRYTLHEQHILIFTLAYIAMVPCANLVGFAGQEFALKLPHVVGVLTEIT
jgi:Ca2+:H+ antiporter